MKCSRSVSCCFLVCLIAGLLVSPAAATADRGSPLGKIVELMTKLQGAVVRSQEKEAVTYKEQVNLCNDMTVDLKEQIKHSQAVKEEKSADKLQADSALSAATSSIDDLSETISTNEAKLAKHEEIREKEKNTAKATNDELMEAAKMLGKAIDILQKELQGSTTFLQASSTMEQLQNVVVGLSAVIEGASVGSPEDLSKLTAMLQTRRGEESPEAYKAKSGGIVDVLQGLSAEATTQLRKSRRSEEKAITNYDLVKEGLKQAIDLDNTELKQAKDDSAKAKGKQAESTEAVAKEDNKLKSATKSLADTQSECMKTATEHEAGVAAHAGEAKALAAGKKLVQAAMAASLAQTQTEEVFSFLQMSTKQRSHSQISGQQVLALVQRLASQQNSDSLKQLASRISALIRYGVKRNKKDPFKKIKDLVQEMIQKLEKEQTEDQSTQKYCDTEMKQTLENQGSLQDESTTLKTKIDQAISASEELKGGVRELHWSLGRLATQREEQDKIRNEKNADFVVEKTELESSLGAIRSAIHVLRDYYAAAKEDDAAASFMQTDSEDTSSDAETDGDADVMKESSHSMEETRSQGAAETIIGMLEVVESEIAKNLARCNEEEDEEQGQYVKDLQSEKVEMAEKNQDITYKTKDYKALDVSVSELQGDHSTAKTELAAVDQYLAKLKEKCVAKPVSYADRKAKRNEEISGLENALALLTA